MSAVGEHLTQGGGRLSVRNQCFLKVEMSFICILHYFVFSGVNPIDVSVRLSKSSETIVYRQTESALTECFDRFHYTDDFVEIKIFYLMTSYKTCFPDEQLVRI